MKQFRIALALCLVFCLCAAIAVAQDAPKSDEAKQDQPDEGKPDAKKEKPKFKKYSEVVTEKAETKEGVFTTHMIDGKVYYEIPADQFGNEFIWVTQFSKVQKGNGWAGMPITSNTVRWVRRGDEVFLHLIDYSLRAEEGTPEEIVVKASNLETIVGAFKIATFKEFQEGDEAEDKQMTPVIDVTDFFLGDVDEFSPKQALRAQSLDKKRSYINSVKSFPKNIETRVLATFARRQGNGNPAGGGFFGDADNAPSVTVEIHHSMVALPERPMMARIQDPRVGFFAGSFEDYSKGVDGIEPVTYISRWRLEKKDPSAAVSEPVKPIVWYVGRGVPEKWRKYVKEGIEMWQSAFEQAGFKNAIIAMEPPDPEVDPDWDAEDARYSVIRWLPSTVRNAFGPHIRDPRSGEILEADVRIFNDVLELGRNWYFTKCAAADPDAQKFPFSDELMGKLLRYVIAHEVGHSLGMRHNHKSSSAYTVEQLRSAEYTKQFGYQASIMDYSRFNYVAQPGDGAVLAWDLDVGYYDKFAVEWGYKQFDGTNSPEEDKKFLNEIAARQLDDPRLLFGSYEEGLVGHADPFARSSDQTGEPIEATAMGLKNLERVMGFIIPATTKDGENFDLLAEIYGAVHAQRMSTMLNVAVLVGGVEYNKKVAGQSSAEVFKPIPAGRQRDAINYLLENTFKTPGWLVNNEITKRIGIAGVSEQVLRTQSIVLITLFELARTARMVDLAATQPDAFTVAEMTEMLTNGIFSELKDGSSIGVYRRNLQNYYVNHLMQLVVGENVPAHDMRAVARGQLMRIASNAREAATSAKDDMTRFHLLDLSQSIEKTLTGEVDLDD